MSKRIVKNIFENTENDKIAISSENNSKISYRDLKIFVEDISKQLSGNGISNKDRAAIVLPNGPSMKRMVRACSLKIPPVNEVLKDFHVLCFF